VLLRRTARPLFATWFVAEGMDAALHPAEHVARIRAAARGLAHRVPAEAELLHRFEDQPSTRLAWAVRAHGAATASAGLMLAFGRNPRTAAAALALLVAPTALVNLPLPAQDRGGKDDRRARRDRLVRAVAFTAGAALVAADTEGRPGVAWRLEQARAERAADAAH
jgi:uncharacterized membrane protein YphA (DoxX/SURF4 family)